MKINRKLNVVFPVFKEDGTELRVHATPISQDVFDKYFDVISITHNLAMSKHMNTAPRICHKLLKQVAEKEGRWADVRIGLRAEILRLANVCVPSERGWTYLMFEDAVNEDHIDSDDADVIEGMLTFFTCSSWMPSGRVAKEITKILGQMWEGQSTSLDCMEYLNSLKTLTQTVASGNPTPSSPPPSIGSSVTDGKRSSAITMTSHGNLLPNSVTEQS